MAEPGGPPPPDMQDILHECIKKQSLFALHIVHYNMDLALHRDLQYHLPVHIRLRFILIRRHHFVMSSLKPFQHSPPAKEQRT